MPMHMNIDAQVGDGMSALHVAVRKGYIEMFQLLIKYLTTPERIAGFYQCGGYYKRTLLHECIANVNHNTVRRVEFVTIIINFMNAHIEYQVMIIHHLPNP